MAELWSLGRAGEKLWLYPVLILMIIFSGPVVLTKGSVVAPLIYTIF